MNMRKREKGVICVKKRGEVGGWKKSGAEPSDAVEITRETSRGGFTLGKCWTSK
jgi:hypothetical protein